MFQTLYPDKWFDSPVEGDPQPSDPLLPFHMDQAGKRWTSDDTKDWTRYNYTYDTLAPSPPTASAFKVLAAQPPPAMVARVHHNPEPATGSLGEQPHNPVPDDNAQDSSVVAHLKQIINSTYGQTRQAVRDSPQIKGNNNDYIINVIYDP